MPESKSPYRDAAVADFRSKKSCLYAIFPAVSLIFLVMFFASSFSFHGYKEKLSSWRTHTRIDTGTDTVINPIIETGINTTIDKCKNQCRLRGSEPLPAGIVSSTSNYRMLQLWEPRPVRGHRYHPPVEDPNLSTNLFAMAVGIRQKDLVDKMVEKFLASDFVVMLFHYDGIVDEWKEFEWSDHVIHVSAMNQSKWWFAKRFLHPDIVTEYGYIFLWDEDLGVEHFNPTRYVNIIKSEGLEISQPALDTKKSEVHHQITARGRRSRVHRRTYKAGNGGKGCNAKSTAPPCTGWIEMMAPVFSSSAWRCVWYMIQSDLVHAWGLDYQLGYCAQGDRTKNVGVVDAEYIIHYNRPTLGGLDETTNSAKEQDHRVDVRRLSYDELKIFRNRWQKAVEDDECWTDPFNSKVQQLE